MSKDKERHRIDDLTPQYDTANEEPYYVRESDGKVFSMEEAGLYFEGKDDDDVDWPYEGDDNPFGPSKREIAEEEQFLLRRQNEFRLAAEMVAEEMGRRPEVEKIALFGSVARPLKREIPRFRKFRRAQVQLPHECKDVDLAVWLNNLDHLRLIQKARSQALNTLMAERNIGVAHHQVDVFLLEPGTDRYLGRLCWFNKCPKGKLDCLVAGCGKTRLLRQHKNFRFNWTSASPDHVVLYSKS